VEFFKKRLGSEKFEELNIRAEILVKRTKQDKEELTEQLKGKIRRLEE